MTELRPAEEMRDSNVEWIGFVPKGWKIARLKNIKAPIKNAIVDGPFGSAISTDDYMDEGVPLVRITNLVNGSVTFDEMVYISEDLAKTLSRSKTVKNDIIFAKTGATVGKCAINNTVENGVLSSSCVKITISNEYDYRYYYYLFCTTSFVEAIVNACIGTTRNTINLQPLSNVNCIIPPVSEQQAIADYLDDHCSKIDEIIAEATASIEEYKELKQAVIFDAVTKGLKKKTYDNNSLDWCESGICSDWDISQIRYLYRLRNERNEKPLEEVNLISLYTDKGVVQHADLEKTTGNKAVTADGYKLVYPEDIIVNIILCWMGAMGRCEYHGVTSPAYDIYEPIDNKRVCSRYYHYLFRTDAFSGKCYTLGRGIMMMRWRTYSSEFRSIKVPVPPMDEQESIANYLDKRVSDINTLITEKKSLIDDLQAYKKSLIYEVVTGKRRVV